jgi:DNA-binding response OmpR family regulator
MAWSQSGDTGTERGVSMAQILVMSERAGEMPDAEQLLPVLALLPHEIRMIAAESDSLTEAVEADLVVLDGRADLSNARTISQLFGSTGGAIPILLVVAESGFAAVNSTWGVSDVVLDTATFAEFDARVRLLLHRPETEGLIQVGSVFIDDQAYIATINGELLDLTFTEFELFKYLAQHPGRVFSREHLLTEVWGYDYFGGARTVDVHVRRLRAKLGPEYEALIGTVRNVGTRFPPEPNARSERDGSGSRPGPMPSRRHRN